MNEEEIALMAQVENELWWYRCLREKIIDKIADKPRDITILDLGCGTGGMLSKLRDAGFTNTVGIDRSPTSITFSKSKGFKVYEGDIRSVGTLVNGQRFDVIISSDVLCYLPEGEALDLLDQIRDLLKLNGTLILNLPAGEIFRGAHDVAVGLVHRTNPTTIKEKLLSLGFELPSFHRWPSLLSPLILTARFGSRLVRSAPKSDVQLPHPLINELFYQITSNEGERWPFGSSIFIEGIRS